MRDSNEVNFKWGNVSWKDFINMSTQFNSPTKSALDLGYGKFKRLWFLFKRQVDCKCGNQVIAQKILINNDLKETNLAKIN